MSYKVPRPVFCAEETTAEEGVGITTHASRPRRLDQIIPTSHDKQQARLTFWCICRTILVLVGKIAANFTKKEITKLKLKLSDSYFHRGLRWEYAILILAERKQFLLVYITEECVEVLEQSCWLALRRGRNVRLLHRSKIVGLLVIYNEFFYFNFLSFSEGSAASLRYTLKFSSEWEHKNIISLKCYTTSI